MIPTMRGTGLFLVFLFLLAAAPQPASACMVCAQSGSEPMDCMNSPGQSGGIECIKRCRRDFCTCTTPGICSGTCGDSPCPVSPEGEKGSRGIRVLLPEKLMLRLAAVHPEAAYLLVSVTNNTYPGDIPRPVSPLKPGVFQGMIQSRPLQDKAAFPGEWPPALPFEVTLEEESGGFRLLIDVFDHPEIGTVSVQIAKDGQASSVEIDTPGGRPLFSGQASLAE